jgi:hypothetical protein
MVTTDFLEYTIKTSVTFTKVAMHYCGKCYAMEIVVNILFSKKYLIFLVRGRSGAVISI